MRITTLTQVQALIDQDIREGVQLDYKQRMYSLEKSDGEEAKISLLKDISAFANTQGGCILIGVTNGEDSPPTLAPVATPTFDKTRSQITALAQGSLSPPLTTLDITRIPNGQGGCFVAINIPPSPLAPHEVVRKKDGQGLLYYHRIGASNILMDASTLRHRLLTFDNLYRRAEGICDERIRVRFDQENWNKVTEPFQRPRFQGISFTYCPVIVTTVVPIESVAFPRIAMTRNIPPVLELRTYDADSMSLQPNASGRIYWREHRNREELVVLGRDGVVEWHLGSPDRTSTSARSCSLRSAQMELHTSVGIFNILTALGKLDFHAPHLISLWICSPIPVLLTTHEGTRHQALDSHLNNTLEAPPIWKVGTVEASAAPSTVEEARRVLLPLFDIVHQAAGQPGSFYTQAEFLRVNSSYIEWLFPGNQERAGNAGPGDS